MMYGVPATATRRLRWAVWSLAAVVAALTVTTDPADARSRRKRVVNKVQPTTIVNSPRYAAFVIDAKSGKTLHEANADSLRHPASLTKIMTLYLLFEQLEAGKIKLNIKMEVSAEAAAQAPTKIGVKPGQTLEVEDAIKALVTKSANDAAVVIAEALAGSEDAFARQMTRKARALGMNRTIYRNASGLPDSEQVTTAREQAILGMAIQERFPRYYRYFSMTAFSYRGHAMRNHNKLLGRVQGVDGIKTGYTRASGFNLVTSVRRSDRHIVAVVLGGSSGAQRDARMRTLIEGHITLASTGAPTRTAVAAAPAVETKAGPKLADAASQPTPAPARSNVAVRPGSTDPIKPVAVKTVMVKLAPPKTAPAVTAPMAAPADTQPEPVAAKPAAIQTASLAPIAPVAPPQPEAPQTVPVSEISPPPGARSGILGVLPVAISTAGKAAVPAASAAEPKTAAPKNIEPKNIEPKTINTKPPTAHSGWAIQVGAFEAEEEAKQRLTKAQSKAAVLKKADPYTERTTKGEKTYYRARFAGFDRNQAEAACKQLKRNDIACMALKI
jgi:D-alanyl-D-alanine carboxypeptidase